MSRLPLKGLAARIPLRPLTGFSRTRAFLSERIDLDLDLDSARSRKRYRRGQEQGSEPNGNERGRQRGA